MNEIVKVCKKHGELISQQTKINNKGIIQCKKCLIEYSNKWKEEKKYYLKEKSLELKELKKQNKLVKECKKHGLLNNKDINIDVRTIMTCSICIRERANSAYGIKKLTRPESNYKKRIKDKKEGRCIKHGENCRNSNGRCKYCNQECSDRWRKNNPEKAKKMFEQIRKRDRTPEKIEKRRNRIKKRRDENPVEYRKLLAEKARKYREELPDAYIKQQIKNQRIFRKEGIKIPIEAIPEELIDIKRMHILLKKKLKEGNNSGDKE